MDHGKDFLSALLTGYTKREVNRLRAQLRPICAPALSPTGGATQTSPAALTEAGASHGFGIASLFHVEQDLWRGRADGARRRFIYQHNLAGDRSEKGFGAIGRRKQVTVPRQTGDCPSAHPLKACKATE